jgi:hypothetical protein
MCKSYKLRVGRQVFLVKRAQALYRLQFHNHALFDDQIQSESIVKDHAVVFKTQHFSARLATIPCGRDAETGAKANSSFLVFDSWRLAGQQRTEN